VVVLFQYGDVLKYPMFFGYLEKFLQEVFAGEENQADCKL
jgi:hypothetical protein